MTVNIGMIGAGVIARSHLKALKAVEGARLVAVCDVVPGKAEAALAETQWTGVNTYTDHREMLAKEKLDAVYVLLAPFAHGPEWDVIEAGCALFVEKPVHIDIAAAEAIRDAIARKGLISCAAYMTRYRRSVQRVRELLADVPQPTLLTGGWFGGTPSVPWWIDKARSGGQHLEQTTHTFDLARYLFGEVDALYASFSKGAINQPDYTIEDASSVNLWFANGAIGNIMSCCVLTTAGGGVHLSVYTNRFVAHFKGWNMSVDIYTGPRADDHVEHIEGEDNIFEIEDRAFVQAVAEGRQDRVLSSYADGVESLRLSVAASQSMETRQPVRLRG
jgi:myo-inositol 2-dehydrogenase/D-chiro-inositol 1-dehydrogenase